LYVGTTTTTTVLWPLYRSTCVSWHVQLRTGGFCWCKVLLPLADGNQRIRIREKTLKFSSTLLYTLSPYRYMYVGTLSNIFRSKKGTDRIYIRTSRLQQEISVTLATIARLAVATRTSTLHTSMQSLTRPPAPGCTQSTAAAVALLHGAQCQLVVAAAADDDDVSRLMTSTSVTPLSHTENNAVIDRRLCPRCCHLGSYSTCLKSSPVHPLTCN